MFTIEQIKTAHSKVKSGADFPAYIKEIKKLGVIYYDTFVSVGHTDFFGVSDFKISSTAKYSTLSIAETSKQKNLNQTLLHTNKEKPTISLFVMILLNRVLKNGLFLWIK